MDIVEHNRGAWNRESKAGGRWSTPFEPDVISAARGGDWEVFLTPNRAVPRAWFGDHLAGKRVLCLASGGGQQVPVLAAAGAAVTSYDNSDEQLAKDRFVADRESLPVETVRGDMADLSALKGASFDLVFHPVSNVFSEVVRPVWLECFRVLKPGGRLLAGFMNPWFFLFDHHEAEATGKLEVRYRLPFSDLRSLSKEKLGALLDQGESLEFGHSLEDQIGGQLEAGFLLAGFYEDDWDDGATPLNPYAKVMIATLAVKPQGR